MNSNRSFLQRNFYQLLLGLIAFGFATLVAELFLIDHIGGSQLFGFVGAIVGVLLALWGIFASAGARKMIAILFVVLALVGGYGVLEHREERSHRQAETSEALADASGITREALEQFDMAPPALSPLGLTGLALLGSLVVFGRRDEQS